MTSKKLFPLAIVVAIIALPLLTLTSMGVLGVNLELPSIGEVTTINVDVYSDSACINQLTSLDWGRISPGNSEEITIYLKNTGNAQITLSLTTNNWTPTNANDYISVSWDKENAKLDPDQVTSATLTLTISESIDEITSFSFSTVIAGTE